MQILRLSALGSLLLPLLSLSASTPAEDRFPFVIPGLATPPAGSVVDLAFLNEGPAGAHGFVRTRDGRFVDGSGKRLRFLATNFTFASCFPEHDMAEKLAARLASFGINCIRFHHMDNQAAPRGLWKPGNPKKNEFDPGQLDRLDYFIAALRRRGIYTNLNLHVSRNYWEGEDFPDGLANDRERQEKLPKYGKGIDKIEDQMIRMQRDYARALLTRVNPYTQTSYAQEPCVAMVEINNENSLLQLKVSDLPDFYQAGVRRKWNAWLQARHGSTAKLTEAWGGAEELGANLLPASPSIQGPSYVSVAPAGAGETTVTLRQIPAPEYHAQLHWGKLTLENGKLYTLDFSARSDLPRRIPVSTRINRADWHNCGLSGTAELGPDWKPYRFTFVAERVEPGVVRLDMVLGGGPVGTFQIKDLTLRRGGSLGLQPGESLEKGNVDAPSRLQNSPRGLDWTRFLSETERTYTAGMREFLKKDLGVQAQIIDTQASYGDIAGIHRESFNDFIDMHAYWQHPRFPGKPWDGSNWLIANTPMVDHPEGGNFLRLAPYRLAGKPFTVSEYDHPAPSHYAAEMFPLMASFAALQDWDGLFQFDWGGTDADQQRINGYFALQQHPAKLAFLPAAAMLFRRGDVEPLRAAARLSLPVSEVDALTAGNVSIQQVWKDAGLTPPHLMTHRLELRLSPDTAKPELAADQDAPSPVTWDPARGLFVIDAPRAKIVAGRCTGKTTSLHGAEFEVKPNPRNFAVLALHAADGKPLLESRRLLLAAAGNVENTGMGWNADHTTVGTQWGRAPTLCEGIAARVTLSTVIPNGSAKIYALDGSGARSSELPATREGDKLTFAVSAACKTLWYEIEL